MKRAKQVVTKRFDYLESLISTGHLEKMPRKMKKAFIRELSARYNLCLIIFDWTFLKPLIERDDGKKESNEVDESTQQVLAQAEVSPEIYY